MMSLFRVGLLLSNTILLSLHTSNAFMVSAPIIQQHHQQYQHHTPLMAAKPLATFEPSDFALSSDQWPYTAADLNRLDNSDDTNFYDTPRFVTHIDDRAIESLTEYYREEMTELLRSENTEKLDVLGLCSSWISHLPADDDSIRYGKVVGIGMNEEELQANVQLTDYRVQNLNTHPELVDFPDNSFDVVCNVVSVDYLSQPRPIFQEMYRVLRPGGVALMTFSNRCFPSKAVAMWLQADDIGRLTIVASYFFYSDCPWERIEALDIKLPNMQTPNRPSVKDIFANPSAAFAWASAASAVARSNGGDPMYVVKGIK